MTKLSSIQVDVSVFMLTSAVDTCSIWNLLSSPRLLSAALGKGCSFVVAGYVHFEAVEKPRSNPSLADIDMRQQFRDRLEKRRGFARMPITVEDLAAVASIQEARKLGRGEIAALALALKLRAAIMTDDQGARRAAPKVGVVGAQTTPHLLGWLLYEGALGDGDVGDVIAEHEERVTETQGRLSKYFRHIHGEAYRCRLLRDHLRTG